MKVTARQAFATGVELKPYSHYYVLLPNGTCLYAGVSRKGAQSVAVSRKGEFLTEAQAKERGLIQ